MVCARTREGATIGLQEGHQTRNTLPPQEQLGPEPWTPLRVIQE